MSELKAVICLEKRCHFTSSVGLICFVRSTLFISAAVKHICGSSSLLCCRRFCLQHLLKSLLDYDDIIGIWVFPFAPLLCHRLYFKYIEMWLILMCADLVRSLLMTSQVFHLNEFLVLLTKCETKKDGLQREAVVSVRDGELFVVETLLNSFHPDGGGITGWSQEHSGGPSSHGVRYWSLMLMLQIASAINGC